jgi:hypothetical protein
MQNFAILSGDFSAAGNFSGYSKKALSFGDHSGRIFISKRQMDSLGLSKAADIKFPIFVTATERDYNRLDANGNPSGETFKRLTAFSVYKTQEDLNAAEVAEAMVDISTQSAVRQAASAAGLSETAVASLLELA